MNQPLKLEGLRILLVEDDYLVAADLKDTLEAAGAEVVGPAGSVDVALNLAKERVSELDYAVLDINLRNARVYPIADFLAAQRIPYIFTTGYDSSALPSTYADTPRIEKPVDTSKLISLLSERLKSGA